MEIHIVFIRMRLPKVPCFHTKDRYGDTKQKSTNSHHKIMFFLSLIRVYFYVSKLSRYPRSNIFSLKCKQTPFIQY